MSSSSARVRRQRSSATRSDGGGAGGDAACHAQRVRALGARRLRAVGNYRLGRTIGEGSFGRVRLAHHTLLPHCAVAVKQIPRARAGGDELAALAREVDLHARLRHRHVMQLLEVVRTEGSIWLVCELCPGGELYDYLVEQATGRLSEREARRILGQLCLAVAYVHDAGMVHRDIKLENVLLDERCNVKLADFGFVSRFDDDELLDTHCGTTGYAAPEMIRGERYRGRQVDIWSLGVILYALLMGALPFDDDSEDIMRAKILLGAFDISDDVSPEAANLLRAILVRDPSKRLTISQILQHPWFQKSISATPSSPPLPAAPTSRHASVRSLPKRAHSYTAPSPEEIGAEPHPGLAPSLAPVPEALAPDDTGSESDVFLDAIAQSDDGATPDEVPADAGIDEPDSDEVEATPARLPTPPGRHFTSSPPAMTSEPLPHSISADPFTLPSESEEADYYALLLLQSRGARGVRAHFSRPLEQHLLSTMSVLGLDVGAIVHSVRRDACDSASALWWLLLRRAEQRENDERLLRSLPRRELALPAKGATTTSALPPASAHTEASSLPDQPLESRRPDSPPIIVIAPGSSPTKELRPHERVSWSWSRSPEETVPSGPPLRAVHRPSDASSISPTATTHPELQGLALTAQLSGSDMPNNSSQALDDAGRSTSAPLLQSPRKEWAMWGHQRTHTIPHPPSPVRPYLPSLQTQQTNSTISLNAHTSSRCASPSPSPHTARPHHDQLQNLEGPFEHGDSSVSLTSAPGGGPSSSVPSPESSANLREGKKGRKNKIRFLSTVRTWLGTTDARSLASSTPGEKNSCPQRGEQEAAAAAAASSSLASSSVSLLPASAASESPGTSPKRKSNAKPTLGSLSMPRRKRKKPSPPATPLGLPIAKLAPLGRSEHSSVGVGGPTVRRSSSLHRTPGRPRANPRRLSLTSQSSAHRPISRRTSETSVSRARPGYPVRTRRQSRSGSTLASRSSAPPGPGDWSGAAGSATPRARVRPGASRASSVLGRVDSVSSVASAGRRPRSVRSARGTTSTPTAQTRHRRSSSESHTIVVRRPLPRRYSSRAESDGVSEHMPRSPQPEGDGTFLRSQFFAHRKRPAIKSPRRRDSTSDSETQPPRREVATWLQSWGNPPPDWAGRVDSGSSPSLARRNELLALLRPKLRDVFASQEDDEDDWVDEEDDEDTFPGYGPAAAGLRPNLPPAEMTRWRYIAPKAAKADSPCASRMMIHVPQASSPLASADPSEPAPDVAAQLDTVTHHLTSLSAHGPHAHPAPPAGMNATVPSGPRILRTAAPPAFTDAPIEEEEEED